MIYKLYNFLFTIKYYKEKSTLYYNMESEKKTVSSEFVQSVKKYLDIDNQLRDIKEKTKTLTLEKKENEGFILEYLQSINEKEIGVVDGRLTRNVSKSQLPLKKEYIQKALVEITGDAIKAQSMADHIIKNRPTVERISLKRIKNRKDTGDNSN